MPSATETIGVPIGPAMSMPRCDEPQRAPKPEVKRPSAGLAKSGRAASAAARAWAARRSAALLIALTWPGPSAESASPEDVAEDVAADEAGAVTGRTFEVAASRPVEEAAGDDAVSVVGAAVGGERQLGGGGRLAQRVEAGEAVPRGGHGADGDRGDGQTAAQRRRATPGGRRGAQATAGVDVTALRCLLGRPARLTGELARVGRQGTAAACGDPAGPRAVRGPAPGRDGRRRDGRGAVPVRAHR